MRMNRHRTLLNLLREYSNGLTVRDLVALTGIREDNLRRCLRSMPDTYIDRWECSGIGPSAAVWCAVPVPPDCPRPSVKRRQ